MSGLQQYLFPYIIVQIVAVIFLLTAWKNTRLARLLMALLFIWASCTNMYTALTTPDVYLNYASMALPLYREFIQGWFSHHHPIIVPLIAAGQFLIGLGMLLKDWWVRLACIGAMIFLLAIVPLTVGSGFPFPLMVSWAAWLIYKKDKKDYLWRKHGASRQPVAGSRQSTSKWEG
jgi:hypothetical protein